MISLYNNSMVINLPEHILNTLAWSPRALKNQNVIALYYHKLCQLVNSCLHHWNEAQINNLNNL
jgi:hypothetical protein